MTRLEEIRATWDASLGGVADADVELLLEAAEALRTLIAEAVVVVEPPGGVRLHVPRVDLDSARAALTPLLDTESGR